MTLNVPHSTFRALRLIVLSLLVLTAVWPAQALELYGFHPAGDGSSDAYLMLTDLGGEGPEFTLEMRDPSGRLLQSWRKLVAPYGSIRLRLTEDVPREAAFLRLESDSAFLQAVYWRVFADGVALSLPMSRPISGSRHVLLHETDAPDTEAFLVLSSLDEEVDYELIWYSERGKAEIERERLRAGALVEIPVREHLPGTLGMLVINPRNGPLWCAYYTRSINAGIESMELPLPLNPQTTFSAPRVSESEEDYLLMADTSGVGAEVQLAFEESGTSDTRQDRLTPHKWLLAPYGTVRIDVDELLEQSREGMIRLHSEATFLAQYALKNEGRISRLPFQKGSGGLTGLTWPIWQPSQIVLRFWNAGDESATPTVLLSRNGLQSSLEREEVFLAPGQLLDWSSDVDADWDNIILRTEKPDTGVLYLGMSGSRLLFVSSLTEGLSD